MAELSSGNDEKSVSRTNSFKIFGKSPSRSFSRKGSLNPLKRIFSKKKSDKQSGTEDERDASVSYRGETQIIEDDAPSVLEKIEKEVPKVMEEKSSKILQEATQIVPQLIQEVVQETKKSDPTGESKKVTLDFKDSTPAIEEKKIESLLDKLKEEKDKIDAELQEKAKESGLENVYKTIVAQPQTEPSDDHSKQIQERSINIEVKGEIQQNDEKEDNCVASLAQGLQQICSPSWNNKKED